MTSSPPDSNRLGGLPGGPTFARPRSESGERPSVRALAAERELDRAAPTNLRKAIPTQDELAKARSKAALDSAVYEAGSQRRMAELAQVDESAVRHWIEFKQRNVPLHLLFRVPDEFALIFVQHVIRFWGRRALLRLRRICDEQLCETSADDGPARIAL